MRFAVICWLIAISNQATDATNNRTFPSTFKFGAANAAAQIEGAYLTDGKTMSIWDAFAHNNPNRISDKSNCDIAADSYHKYKEDIAALKAVGMQTYRFSIAWSRILPTGHANKINEAGVRYYKSLLKELKANNIEPFVTLYHWDLPQILEETIGGWLNESISDLFADYARVCFKLFGDEVRWWITLNEPKQVCHAGYGAGFYAPGISSNGVKEYDCVKNVLLAHAKAYRIYEKEFKQTQNGKMSIVMDSLWYEPGSNSAADEEAAERTLQFNFGLYGHPIYIGDWPKVVKDRIAYRSKLEGFKQSRLPELTEDEINLIKGTNDFIALNHYSTSMINATKEPAIGSPSFDKDIGTLEWKKPEWPSTGSSWFRVVPWGLRKTLVWLKKTYGDREIIITENGLSDHNGTSVDDHRIRYIRDYLSSCLDAIYEDKVNLTTYFLWSIIDDWEWTGGYQYFLGIYSVNFTDPARPRTPKKSASYFKQITANRCLVDKCVD